MFSITPASTLRKSNKWVCLSVLTCTYIMGELSHFLLGIVTRPMSQEIEYGDKGCLSNPDANDIAGVEKIDCYTANSTESCTDLGYLPSTNVSACVWDYSGLGLEYQILAGPSFIFVFTISGVLIALVLDRFSRHAVVTICLFVLTLSTILMGAAKLYWHLVVLRMLIGAGESSMSPGCSSIISDIFSQAEQGLALGIFNWGIYFGYGLSFTIGNFVTAADIAGLGWRFSFYISGVFGILVTLGMLLFVREPPRAGNQDKSKLYEHSEEISKAYNGSKESHFNLKREELNNEKMEIGYDKKRSNSNSNESLSNGYRMGSDDVSFFAQAERGGSSTDMTKSPAEESKLVAKSDTWKSLIFGKSGLFTAFKALLSPPLALMTIAASIRHTAGFTWAYNTQLYFSTYYPTYNLGYWISGCSIVGGTIGVAIGGLVSDKLVKRIGIKARMLVLGGSQLVATPFAAGVLFLSPPYAFYSLLLSYLFAEMWFGVVFAVLLELVPAETQSTSIAFFLFIINNIGGNVPVLVAPLRNALSYRTALAIMYPGNYLLSAILFFLTIFLL